MRAACWLPRPGPIPARAGQPAAIHRGKSWSRAYPRSRGATPRHRLLALWPRGLSPLARGNRGTATLPRVWCGPIPARAGQPSHGEARRSGCGAYPRSRGATLFSVTAKLRAWGLSPLARGNRCRSRANGVFPRPIPARAGQPLRGALPFAQGGAYPRSRGATVMVVVPVIRTRGLSPLARGNQPRLELMFYREGPIPARAGQPASGPVQCTR